MTFTEALAVWDRWQDKSVPGGLVFCDWCQDFGMPEYYTQNWRRYLRAYGTQHITNELRRLAAAESARPAAARAAMEVARRAQA